jgi:hypothetical protein
VQSESQQEVTRRLPCLGFDPSFFTPGQATEAVEEGGQSDFDKMHTLGAGKLVQRELPCGMSLRLSPKGARSSGAFPCVSTPDQEGLGPSVSPDGLIKWLG